MKALFEELGAFIDLAGFEARKGQMLDASLVQKPKTRKPAEPRDGEPELARQQAAHRDGETNWTQKHDRSYFGYKNHINADVEHGFIRDYAVTPAISRNAISQASCSTRGWKSNPTRSGRDGLLRSGPARLRLNRRNIPERGERRFQVIDDFPSHTIRQRQVIVAIEVVVLVLNDPACGFKPLIDLQTSHGFQSHGSTKAQYGRSGLATANPLPDGT